MFYRVGNTALTSAFNNRAGCFSDTVFVHISTVLVFRKGSVGFFIGIKISEGRCSQTCSSSQMLATKLCSSKFCPPDSDNLVVPEFRLRREVAFWAS